MSQKKSSADKDKRKRRTCDEFNPKTVNKFGFSSSSHDNSPCSSSLNTTLTRERERKWFEMLKNWDHLMTSSYDKVRVRCRKGIPHSLRAAVWRALCGAANLQQKNPGMFEDLLRKESQWMVYIEKDLPRTYKLHELFAEEGGLGQTEMKKVLKAYSIYNPKVGYCQGMTSIAGILLMLMPAEQAFWCLVAIMNKYLPGYFSDGLLAVQLDGRVMESLVNDIDPKISAFLRRNDVQATFYAVEWFLCAYTRTLPWETVLRIWDMFLCEGVKVLIKTGVTLLMLAFSDKKVRDVCDSFDKALKYLKYRLPDQLLEEDFFVNELLSLHISEEQLKETHLAQLAKLQDIYR
ncbi:TBC1 domain family member 10A-like [Bolinopsis microptera]|uniref:TBC1 domain family member 10A-like n=1 Tax=Bolinopsis microptera TaxID=2820187 RepID=UPI0030794D69